MTDSATLSSFEQRLTRLERANRRLSVLLVVALTAAVVAFARPDQSVPDEIAAHRFRLIDADGNECAHWASEKMEGQKIGGGSLAFVGDDGIRVLLSTGNGNPTLLMNGGGRLQRDSRLGHAEIGVQAESGPRVLLWGQNIDAQGDALLDRSTELRTCWGANTHALITKCGEGAPWTAP